MGAIPVDTYVTIAGEYSDAYTSVQTVSAYYYDAAYEVLNIASFDPEVDLLVPFYNAYNTADAVVAEPPSSVVTAVNRLQAHVLNKARYDLDGTVYQFVDINDWLSATVNGENVTRMRSATEAETNTSAITVPAGFAELSSRAGYAIDAGNIA